jgi:hypothetical protein
MKTTQFLLAFSLLFSFGCSVQREPGPAERIGRAIDDIHQSVSELAPQETADERRAREDREWHRRQDEYYQKNRTRDVNLYGDSKADSEIFDPKKRDQEARDREYWENPIADDTRENDRY